MQSSSVTLFHTDFILPRLQIAIDAACDILKQKGLILYKVPVLGDTFEEQLFDMILWADFASYYLGMLRGADVISVKIIDTLKEKYKQKGFN
jgi:hypothetical protein